MAGITISSQEKLTQLSKFDISTFFLSNFVGIIHFFHHFNLNKSTVLMKEKKNQMAVVKIITEHHSHL